MPKTDNFQLIAFSRNFQLHPTMTTATPSCHPVANTSQDITNEDEKCLRCTSTSVHRFHWKTLCTNAVDTFSGNAKCTQICLCESIFVVTAAISQAGRQPLEGWDALRISSETSAFECCAEKYLHNVHKMHGRWWKWAPQLSHPTVEHLCHFFFFFFIRQLAFIRRVRILCCAASTFSLLHVLCMGCVGVEQTENIIRTDFMEILNSRVGIVSLINISETGTSR